jgi:pseudaminic acid synthase
MNSGILIGRRVVGAGAEPFVIAEMSGNHNQSLPRALEIVEAAAASGAHAIKLQTYTADTITLDAPQREFRINDEASLWRGKTLYELYSEAHTPWAWHAPIMRRAKELGLECFSSPFDETAVDFLEELGVPAYKIASFENNHLPLIRKAAATGKPLIISTGMATVAELDEAVRTARGAGCSDLILLKCTSTYPATPENTNIATIPHMATMFGCEVGLSDHTMGVGVAVAAVALGATIIEKHFTLRRADGGVDSAFSLEPQELAMLVAETARAWKAIGTVKYGPTAAEQKSLTYRRSLYVAETMKAGDVFTVRNLRVIRPGDGLHPRFYEQILGMRVARDVPKGTPVAWEMLGHS